MESVLVSPSFALGWKDPASQHISAGFKDLGFLPEHLLIIARTLGTRLLGTEQNFHN